MNDEEDQTLGTGKGVPGPVLGKSPETVSRVGLETGCLWRMSLLPLDGEQLQKAGEGRVRQLSGGCVAGSGERWAICLGYNWEP